MLNSRKTSITIAVMEPPLYPWKRFWCPRGGTISLADQGFLLDPNSEYAKYHESDVRSFESISDIDCLVLLGEPGIGKSTTLQAEFEKARQAAEVTGDLAVLFNLRDYSTDERLERKVFQSESILRWRDGEGLLYLFLDSLDEGLLRIDNIASVLLTELKEFPCTRLRLRVACRPADWPVTLEQGLIDLWGEAHVRTFELVPLRRVDVASAAQASGIEPDRLIQEVIDRDVVPLAIKPVTLKFLTATFLKDGTLPTSRVELYSEGCKRLCEETNPHRRDSPQGRGKLSASQRLALAARVAAVTQFSNRSAVWFGSTDGIEPEDAPLESLTGVERERGHELTVDIASLREVLDTGLFAAAGPYRQRWRHQTYAEFLAAYYLHIHRVSPSKLRKIFLHPDDSSKLIPQLRETAAWLAGMSTEAFQLLVRTDPEYLLGSEVAAATHADRAILARRLLNGFELGTILQSVWEIRHNFPRLDCPALPTIVQVYVADSSRSRDARIVALEIIRACRLSSLMKDVLPLALSDQEHIDIRVRATAAIAALGNSELRRALRPLALGSASDDARDDLKGYALAATWPEHLETSELFAALTPPKTNHHFGPYARFLDSGLATQVSARDLTAALTWATQHTRGRDELDKLHKLASDILVRAVDCIDQPQILDLLAQALFERAKAYTDSDRITARLCAAGDGSRRSMSRAMFSMAAGVPHGPYYIMDICAIMPADVPWLLSELTTTAADGIRRTISELISRRLDPNDVETIDAVLTAAVGIDQLKSAMEPFLSAVELGSPLADDLKRHHELLTARHEPKAAAPAVPMEQAVDQALTSNLPDAFFRVDMILSNHERKSDPAGPYPEWQRLSVQTRSLIIASARRYLTARPPTPAGDWWRQGIFTNGLLAAYGALLLLTVEAPEALDQLDAADWEFWTRIAVPIWNGGRDDQGRSTLLGKAYQRASNTFLATLSDVIDGENERHKRVFVVDRLEDLWNEEVTVLLREKLAGPTLCPDSFRCILGKLLEKGDVEAKAVARTLATGKIAEAGEERKRAVLATVELLASDVAEWRDVWPVLQANQPFGVEVLELVAYEREYSSFALNLDEGEIAEICIWLSAHGLDKKDEPSGFVTPARALANWWNTLINYLMNKGSAGACHAIEHLIEALPQYADGLQHCLRTAEDRFRRSTWSPLAPDEVFRLAEWDAGGALVMSLHGIRTRGEWQKQVNSQLQAMGFRHELLDYGFFRAWRLLMPWLRARQVARFRMEYEALTAGTSALPSVIAHSFGTYIVAAAMDKYAEIRFDRIILCGSIVRREYDWDSLIDSGRVSAVLNEYGGKDFWSKTAAWCIWDGGASGARGFLTRHGRVFQRRRPLFRHSDYFYPLNYRENWVPFLEGAEPSDQPRERPGGINWRFLTLAIIVVATLFIVYVLISRR